MVDDIQTNPDAAEDQTRWYVVHTLPRCEKKLLEHFIREQFEATLPCYPSVRKYRGKTVVFEKPLFPGYVFLKACPPHTSAIRQNEHVANLLEVHDQTTLELQLAEIQLALSTGLEVRLAPTIGEGMRVRIKAGPLRGVEGWVEQRHGLDTVLLRLDFINQAAAFRLGAEMLESV
jgi:transcription antitermination factor NusG